MEKEHIFVVVPTMDNMLSTGAAWLLMNAQKRNADENCKYKFSTSIINGRSPVEYMRNSLIHEFLKTDATRIWMMDNDMQPAHNAFDLLETEGDIVAGFFYMFKHAGANNPTTLQICAFNNAEDGQQHPIIWDGGDPIVDVDSVGTGSTIIRRELFEDDRLMLTDKFINLAGEEESLHTDYPNVPKCYFRRHYGPNGQVIRGADIDFCLRAKKAGYSVRVNMGVKFGQVNRVNLNEMASLLSTANVNKAVPDYSLTSDDIKAVHEAWGNKSYAAPVEYMELMAKMARNSDGAIVECGSGATTMILQQLCRENPGLEVLSLEHDEGWYKKAQKLMNPDVANHRLVHAPIKDSWYNLDGVDLPERIGMVVVDGPPGAIGRYGAFPALKPRLHYGYAFLVDDARRDKPMLDRWQNEFGVRVNMVSDKGRGIAVVTGDGITA